MKISVIVPVYNVPVPLLRACLDSIRIQTLRLNEYEVILVDDCSTDKKTIAAIETFIEETPNIILVRHSDNRGLNEARRSGVAAATSNYVVFLDGDDILTRDAIENLRMEAAKTEADLVTAPFFRWNSQLYRYGNLPIVDRALPAKHLDCLKNVVAGKHSFTMCGRLFKKDVLTDDIFNMPRLLHEDLVTFVRCLFEVESSSHIHKPIYYYTLNSDSITHNFFGNHVESVFWAIDDWIKSAKKNAVLYELYPALPIGVEKLINMCIERCVVTEKLTQDEKRELLNSICERYLALPLLRFEPSLPGTVALTKIETSDIAFSSIEAFKIFENASAEYGRQELKPEDAFKRGIQPSDIAQRLKDKIVLICQVDYQLRNAAAFARELRARGHACVVLDNSAFASGGLRQLPNEENNIFWRTERIKIPKPPYEPDWLSTAKLVIAFNDFNDDFREALEYRYRLGLAAACVVEGINDFLRIDFTEYRHLPYRRCDYVFLAGENDKKHFDDRNTYVTGLPVIEKLAEISPVFPKEFLAVLNVNFTYGTLEDKRGEFIAKAKNAFSAAGFDWTITQHPADKADLSDMPVSELSQYELIEQGSVFVSRFATGILEALASGKPAIYFNPHGEKVDKYKEPMGAFEIATSEEELIAALHKVKRQIKAGVDFRKRALPFLKHHTNYSPGGPSVVECFADAAADILEKELASQAKMLDLFFNRLHEAQPFRTEQPGVVFGTFDRAHKAQLNDEEMIARYFGDTGDVMIDVGANFGNSCDVYLGKGWTVHAFEPDPNNREKLQSGWPDCPRLIISEEAVSDKSGQKLPFYASEESTGISGLSAFTSGHKKISEVTTITLRDYYKKTGLKHADFLKIDVEGFDKFVLDGFPWESDKPEVVLAEFEDAKTLPLGYSAHDIAEMMQAQDYVVYISEWHSIVRYGIAHDWKRFVRYSPELDLTKTWGNMIGFREDPGEDRLRSLIRSTIKFAVNPFPAPAAPKGQSPAKKTSAPPVPPRPFYANFGERLMRRAPRVFALLRFTRRILAGLWRRRFWTAPALILIAGLAALGFLPAFAEHRFAVWTGAAFAAVLFALFYLALRVYHIATALGAETAALRKKTIETERQLKTAAAERQRHAGRAESLEQANRDLRRQLNARIVDLTSEVKTTAEHLKSEIAETAKASKERDATLKGQIAETAKISDEREAALKGEIAKASKAVEKRAAPAKGVKLLRERVAASERQIGALRYPHAPSTLVFFGHHKCASRFFRNEVFAIAAEATGAGVRKYEIKNPPFHYSMSDDLDLCNMDFNGLGDNGRDVVLFSNATTRSLEKIKNSATNWRGLRILRDPRQVLVSNYFHHMGEHVTEYAGWVWDQLARDKPILRELPKEEGLLYELDSISKQIIETQLLAAFDDECVLTLKIEEFSKDPKAHLSRISAFLRVPDIAGIDFDRTAANPESGPWQQHFTSRLREVFKKRYGKALIDLGYAEDLDW